MTHLWVKCGTACEEVRQRELVADLMLSFGGLENLFGYPRRDLPPARAQPLAQVGEDEGVPEEDQKQEGEDWLLVEEAEDTEEEVDRESRVLFHFIILK